jgi:hypothetical protein
MFPFVGTVVVACQNEYLPPIETPKQERTSNVPVVIQESRKSETVKSRNAVNSSSLPRIVMGKSQRAASWFRIRQIPRLTTFGRLRLAVPARSSLGGWSRDSLLVPPSSQPALIPSIDFPEALRRKSSPFRLVASQCRNPIVIILLFQDQNPGRSIFPPQEQTP